MNTKDTSTKDLPHERFLIDTDADPEIAVLLRKVGFRARSAHTLRVPNDDTSYLIWARKHGYILVAHDKHKDTETKYSFYAEMFYRGGQLIRISRKPDQSPLLALGKILVHRPTWQKYFQKDSGEVVVHQQGCNFTPAAKLFERINNYKMRLPLEDPAVPLKNRQPLESRPRRRNRPVTASAELIQPTD